MPLNNRLTVCFIAILFSVSLLEGEVRLGADRLFESPYFGWIKGKRVGLITNQTGVNSQLKSVSDLLAGNKNVELVAVFGPEHGFSGAMQAGQKISSQGTVYSLYGATRAPTESMLMNLDLLLFDLQDVGARFYTYISTMFLSMQAASQRDIPFIVLDRPNPISGLSVEGPVLEAGFESFVGIYPLPIRYGLTSGELARMLNVEANLSVDLRIVPVEGWNRDQWYDHLNLEWIPPSPNIPTLDTAAVYPGTCLIEGTNLSEGRGTTRPFELLGAPWLDAKKLAGRLNKLALPGVFFRSQTFTPTFSKYENIVCQGVQLHVTDRELFQPISTVLYLLSETLELHPSQLTFRLEFFNRLAGNSWIHQGLADGKPIPELVYRWQQELAKFKQKRVKYLLYP